MAGVIAKVLSTLRVTRDGVSRLTVKSEPGGGEFTPDHFGPAGDDSAPLSGDFLGGIPVQGTGRGVVSGYVDPVNPGIALGGEVRRYGRDEAGAIVSSVHLFRDGSIELVSVPGASGFTLGADGSITGFNASGDFKLAANGDFEVNGAKIDASGEITNAAGIVLGTHDHTPGTFLGDGNPVTPGPVTGISGPPQ